MFPAMGPRDPILYLSRQQARSLAAVAVTSTRADAAELLAISRHTLGNHLRAAFERLGAASLHEAWWRAGMLVIPVDALELPIGEPPQLVWIRGMEGMRVGSIGSVPAVRIALTEEEVREAARLIRDQQAGGHHRLAAAYLAIFATWDRDAIALELDRLERESPMA